MLLLSKISKATLWGGKRLWEYGGDQDCKELGQLYTVAANEDLSCKIENGPQKDQLLYDVFMNNPQSFGYQKDEPFPLLIGFVDARENLSVQIHPDIETAQLYEKKSFGKNESWIFLQAPLEHRIINGCKCNDYEELNTLINQQRWEAVIDTLEVQALDYVYVESGTIHALTAGSLVYEIQQSTDITYRFYDYDRRDQAGNRRELQLDKALKVLDINKKSNAISIEKTKHFKEKDYEVIVRELENNYVNDNERFCCITAIENEFEADGLRVDKGSSLLLMPGEKVSIKGHSKCIVAIPQ